MLHYVAVVRTDVLEEHSASIIRVTRLGKLGTTLVVWNGDLLNSAQLPRFSYGILMAIKHFFENNLHDNKIWVGNIK
jgi:hypothetical protein